jgi:pSer/pThr/pTyr-binding forkhead associated (FHA) protein
MRPEYLWISGPNFSRVRGAFRVMASDTKTTVEQRTSPPSGASALVLSGFYEGLEVSLDRERMVIGRGRKADLALAEATISRAHAAIGFDGQVFYVEDLDSTNGTLVNGSRITKQRLKSDDEIQMGKLRIGVMLPQ